MSPGSLGLCLCVRVPSILRRHLHHACEPITLVETGFFKPLVRPFYPLNNMLLWLTCVSVERHGFSIY